jgi:N-acetylmuramoyl-L-alanine amidase
MRTARPAPSRALRAAAALTLLCLALPVALADEGYVTAPELAQMMAMDYRDLSEGATHACKIYGNGHEIMVFTDVRSLIVDGVPMNLTRPTRWNGRVIVIPEDAADLLLAKFNIARADAPAPEVKPAPRPTAKLAARKRPFKVVVDAGHGGKDPGAMGRSGLREKDVNLDVARRLAVFLEERGVDVVMTRRSDVYVSLEDRTAIANRVNPDLFVSIHANADNLRSLQGAMFLYPDDGLDDGRPNLFGRAKAAAGRKALSLEELGAGGPVDKDVLLLVTAVAFEGFRARSILAAQTIRGALEPVTGTIEKSNGILEDFRGLRVLRETRAPAVIVETDYLSNRMSERKLARASYRNEIADAVGEAVIKYLNAIADGPR